MASIVIGVCPWLPLNTMSLFEWNSSSPCKGLLCSSTNVIWPWQWVHLMPSLCILQETNMRRSWNFLLMKFSSDRHRNDCVMCRKSPVQNENTGALVQKLLIISRWQLLVIKPSEGPFSTKGSLHLDCMPMNPVLDRNCSKSLSPQLWQN